MSEERTRRWQKSEPLATVPDPMGVLRSAIVTVRRDPRDLEARRQLRAIAAAQGMEEQVRVLMLDEARAHADRPDVALAFWEELADLHEAQDQLLELIAAMEQVTAIAAGDFDHLDRLAWLYRKAGAWQKSAETFELVGAETDDRGRAAMRAAAKLYRDNGRLDRAAVVYRAILVRRPADAEAWRALDEILAELGRWSELAEVRGQRAARANGVDKAALLRAQARALEQAGDLTSAAGVVEAAAEHAPDDISGVVDYADVLARSGRDGEAAGLLRQRVAHAVERGASVEDIAGLRLRLAGILEVADPPAARAILEELLAAAPVYLPALERVAALAAADPDPRVHAGALLRYASALPEGEDRSAYVIAAARRYREAGDHGAAARALEQALRLAGDADPLRRELAEARTAEQVETYAAQARTGDTGGAVDRLRQLLRQERHHVEANLALVEILAGANRLDAAAEHLRDTLADAPDDMPEPELARLVFRLAGVMKALGDEEDAHQLLDDAHRLDRRALPITLALGESCFARKLWRQAALHLAACAEHPDVARHASAVAAGLVLAAQAEVRALRPGNAPRHIDAAVRLDPRCAPAWHALAEAAIERGDLVRAAECLEHEADATTAARDRLRLYDALADMALDVLGDPPRAERCLLQIVDGAPAPVLDKLLALQRKRGASEALAATLVRRAVLAEPADARPFLEEAAAAFTASGRHARAMELAEDLMRRYPRELSVVAVAGDAALAAGDAKRAAVWLRNTLTAVEPSPDRKLVPDAPRRAALWRRLGDAQRDLGDEAAAVAAYERSLAADGAGQEALAARRGLVELASSTGRDQHSSLFALVEAGHDPFDALAWARSCVRAGELEDARAGFELARAVGARLTADDDRFLTAHPARAMAADEGYASLLDADDRAALIDDPDEGVLGKVLELLAEALPLVAPAAQAALLDSDLLEASRLPATSEAAIAAMYPQIVKLLGGPPTLLHTAVHGAHAGGPGLLAHPPTLLFASPPVVVFGPRVASVRARDLAPADAAELRFLLGRVVELSRPSRIFAGGQDADAFARLVAALHHAFGSPVPTAPRDTAAAADRLRAKVPVALRGRLTEWLGGVDAAQLDAPAHRAACERAADRAGLLACGDISVAVAAAPHVAKVAASRRYLTVRRRLRRT